jgi:formyl-CoA transferase/CoA:oxalate CoA-transferase
LNLQSEEGKEILFKLFKQSDIIIENFTPGTVERLGIDYHKMREINPKIIYCQISGYGQDGPYCTRRAMDQIIQGEGGLMSFTGTPDTPCKVGVPITDIIAAMNAVYGILIALIYRERTGRGQRIDVSMFDGQVAFLSYQAQRYWLLGEIASRMGSEHPLIIPYQAFKTKDQKYINIGVINRETWQRFCEATNLENLIDDPKFSTTEKRVENRRELTGIIEPVILQKDREEWLDILTKAKIPCGSINNVAEVLNHPQTIHRKMVEELDHPILGEIKLTGIPVKLSESPGEVRTPPPLLGQHTEEVLKSL